MSKIEVDKIIPQSGTALQVGDSGDTITIPAGATITNNGTANGFGSADTEKVKVSSNDTTAGFLNGKLVAGTNISLTEGSDGGNETLTAALSGTISTAQIGANQVTGAKLNTDVISAQTELAAEPADTDELLVSDAGVLKRVDYSYIKGGYTQSSVLTPTGSFIEFDNIPSGTNSIVIKSYAIQWAGSPGNISMQIGDSGGYETSGYESVDFYRGVSAGDMGATALTSGYILAYGYSGTDYWNGNLFLNHVGGNRWVSTYTAQDVGEYIRMGSGQKTLSGELTKLKIINAGGENSDGGQIQIMYQ